MNENDNEKSKLRFENDLNRLKDSLTVASENYHIWWIYKRDRPKYVDVMNKYLAFFSASIHAHFLAMLLSITKVLETKDKKGLSLFSCMSYARENSLIDESVIRNSEKKLHGLRTLIGKIQIMRNNHFAHLSKQLTYSQTLDKAEITYDDFKNLIDSACEILNDISYAFDRSTRSFSCGAENHTYAFLEDLLFANKMKETM